MLTPKKRRFLRVRVTPDDIRNGRPQEASACPIYLAMCRAAEADEWPFLPAYVDGGCVCVEDGDGHQQTIELPTEAMEFVEKFDMTGKGRRFSFQLDLGEEPCQPETSICA